MFLRVLFDMSFKSWATPDVVRFMFVLGLIVSALGVLAFDYQQTVTILATMDRAKDFPLSEVASVVLSPLAWLVMVVFLRIGAEFTLVVFRISEQLERR
jgi:hypothetical protein